MRIICPECDAQYEVPDEVVPPEGRDVQCSNCNSTWFVAHPDHPGAAQARADDAQDPKSVADAREAAGEGRPSEDDEVGAEETPPPSPPRRELDPDVARILREEAQRETDARAADGLEVQPDLGLTQVARPPSTPAHEAERPSQQGSDAKEPIAGGPETRPDHADGEETAFRARSAPGVPPDTAPRADLLPDVEELNSTLRSSGNMVDRGPEASAYGRRRRGFRRGFLAAVLIFVIGLLIYQFAPEIAEALPQVDPWLSAYVTWADEMRTILDGLVRNFLTWLDTLTVPEI